MTGARPDPGSDLAGAGSEYGNDTGFATESTNTDSATGTGTDPGAGSGDDSAGLTAEDDSAGLTAEDDPAGSAPDGAGAETEAATTPSGPGDGAD